MKALGALSVLRWVWGWGPPGLYSDWTGTTFSFGFHMISKFSHIFPCFHMIYKLSHFHRFHIYLHWCWIQNIDSRFPYISWWFWPEKRKIHIDISPSQPPTSVEVIMIPHQLTRMPNSSCSCSSHGVISGTKRGIIDALVSKRPEKF